MKKKKKVILSIGVSLTASFVLWTLLLCCVDVQIIGAEGATVGFATLNKAFHSFSGVNMWLYRITDYLSVIPLAMSIGFAILGTVQWICRKSIRKVDRSLLALGVFYLVVIAVYVFFETVIINERPILIDGQREASYPSSTTMLVMCVMTTAAMQLHERIQKRSLKYIAVISVLAFMFFMVSGRLFSGVHWITDIIGGALFSAGTVLIYASFSYFHPHKHK